jgi:integrase
MRAILESIADQGQGREAEKRRQVCTAMFRWALSQDIVEADPTAGLTPYDRGAPRDRVLTLEEIELVWKWLETDALSLEAADILKLELLTGARCGEISGLRRGDRPPKKDVDAACGALEEWASTRHADCGPRA